MKRPSVIRLTSAMALLMLASPALANDNEVYIGQTGVTNRVAIDQLGEANMVGANDSSLFVLQDGSNNDVAVTQTGYANQAGATGSAGAVGLQGLYQTGDSNSLTITQQSTASTGLNVIGAVSQVAPTSLASGPSNSLTITQTDASILGAVGSGNGDSAHTVGEILQIQTGTSANIATISQYDGSNGGDTGNRVQILVQDGTDNLATITQQEAANQVGDLRQFGSGNGATVTQEDGTDNRLDTFRQDGTGNRAIVTMTGSRNLVFSLLQNNALMGVVGNLATITLGGDDNGGDGMGGLGQFTNNVTRLLQVAQAELRQLGDENMLNFVTSGASVANLYGFVQDGDGNVISGTVDGEENEVALLQIGDGNRYDFSQTGNLNATAVSSRGDNNSLFIEQDGNDNIIDVSFDGGVAPITRSNQNNDPALGGFSELALSHAGSLEPGDIRQSGDQNSIRIATENSNFNKFATSQNGNQNVIEGEIIGDNNQAVVIQSGDLNYTLLRQTGNYNQAVILQ
ncbi:hypothetical protein [Cohaesibacter intestini]|uniref:hypothetical protein n=1 Tax=Cohaesibacter intestini TaxID=2211145 RepID=UPI000DE8742C|nr:hypothetical protein [Cohaesibacter intestini]